MIHRRRPLPDTVAQAPKSGWKKWGRRFLCICGLLLAAVATAVLIKISYPKPSHAWVAWLALAPFAIAVTCLRRLWQSFFYSWFVGVLVYAGLYEWIFITCFYGGGVSWGLSVAAWLGLSVLMALQVAIFGGSCYYLKKLTWMFPVLAAIGWVALEWLHETLASYVLGFPWFSLAYSQWNMPQVLQVASITGVAGVSFLVAFTGISVGYAFVTTSLKRGVWQLLVAGLVFGGNYGYGQWVLNHQASRSLLRVQAAIMQPNIDQYKKWSPAFEQEIADTLSDMSRELEGKNDLLVIWPESVTPGPVEEEPYLSWIQEIANRTSAWQLVGTNREENNTQYVSTALFTPKGDIAAFYNKTHLVPFGEFIPFERQVRAWLPQVEVLGELGSFTPGEKKQPLLQLEQVLFGTTICYESIFSQLWKEQVRSGARFLVNSTNDAWFFDTDAPYQHLAVSVLRAVETRRTVLRAANTGISAVITPTGEITERAQLNTRAILQAQVPLALGEDFSFYVEWGHWFAWLCAAIYLTILISAMVFAYE